MKTKLFAAIGLLILAMLLTAAWTARDMRDAPSAALEAPVAAKSLLPAQYVANGECLGCHAEQAAKWQSSHHAKAMAPATAQTVLGAFDGRTFKHQGVVSHFFQRDGKFVVRTDGPDGKLTDFEVAYAFGVAPLQQYLIALPGGRL